MSRILHCTMLDEHRTILDEFELPSGVEPHEVVFELVHLVKWRFGFHRDTTTTIRGWISQCGNDKYQITLPTNTTLLIEYTVCSEQYS